MGSVEAARRAGRYEANKEANKAVKNKIETQTQDLRNAPREWREDVH
jgi:hypothetical protein